MEYSPLWIWKKKPLSIIGCHCLVFCSFSKVCISLLEEPVRSRASPWLPCPLGCNTNTLLEILGRGTPQTTSTAPLCTPNTPCHCRGRVHQHQPRAAAHSAGAEGAHQGQGGVRGAGGAIPVRPHQGGAEHQRQAQQCEPYQPINAATRVYWGGGHRMDVVLKAETDVHCTF